MPEKAIFISLRDVTQKTTEVETNVSSGVLKWLIAIDALWTNILVLLDTILYFCRKKQKLFT